MQVENQTTVETEVPISDTITLQVGDPIVTPGGQNSDQQPAEGQEQVTEQQPRQIPPDIEKRARETGWVPLNEWRGDPAQWRPADEYVRRGEEFIPIIRAERNRARAEAAELRQQMESRDRDFEDRIRRLDRVSQIALQNQAQQIGQYYQGMMRQAVERGDVEGWDALNRQYANEIGQLQTNAAQAYQPPTLTPQEQQWQEEQRRRQAEADPQYQHDKKFVEQWIGRQGWWHRDPEMQNAAKNYHGYLQQTQRMSIEDNLAEVERYMQQEFPDRLQKRAAPANGNGQPRQQQTQHAPAMESGTRQPAGANRAKGWNELPPEAKQAGDSFIRNDGLFLPDGADTERLSDADITKARAAYAKRYWEE
jgi:hypothetical protein